MSHDNEIEYIRAIDALRDPWQARIAFDCKKLAAKVHVTVQYDKIPGHKDEQLVTRFTYYDKDDKQCDEARLYLPGDPYGKEEGFEHTIVLTSSSGGTMAAAIAALEEDFSSDEIVTGYGFTSHDKHVLYAGGITPITAGDFFEQIVLGTDSQVTYQRLVDLLDTNSRVIGSAGLDAIEIGGGNDTVNAFGGDDIAFKWQSGNLIYNGGAGSDTLTFNTAGGITFVSPFVQQLVVNLTTGTGKNPYGGNLKLTGVENVIGTSEADRITGNDAANIIGDAIYDDSSGDVIDARGGNDTIGFSSFAGFFPADPGADIDGGTGTDTLVFQFDYENGNLLDLTNQANNAGTFRASTFANIERFVVGPDFASSFSDLEFRGNDAANWLEVSQGKLDIDMRGGNDTLVLRAINTSDPVTASGGAGIDTLIFTGRGGFNVLDLINPANNSGPFANATFGNFEIFKMGPVLPNLVPFDVQFDFRGNGAANTAIGGGDADALAGAAGSDVLSGLGGNDRLNGGIGSDRLTGGDGNDFMEGGSEADTLNGGLGNDRMNGQAGNDRLAGLAGNDTLTGGAGNDTMTGGTGVDSFVFDARPFGDDSIADFGDGVDRLRVSRAVADSVSDFSIQGNGTANVTLSIGADSIVLNGPGPILINNADFVFFG